LVVFEVVDEFFVFVSIVDGEFEFSFFGPKNDRLTFHAADHVEGSFGLAAQCHLQQVFLDPRLDGFAQLAGDLKEAVRGAETFDALMWPLVIIIFDPEADSLSRRLEALELSPGKELLPDRFPKAFDLPEGHGMMRPGFEVMGPVLLHLRLEACGAAPVDVFPAIVGKHFLGRLIFAGRHPEHLQNILRAVTAKQICPDEEPGIIIHEPDEVGVFASQTERENIRLPHLVGRGPLKESGPTQVAPGFRRAFHQALLFERLANRLTAGGQKENPPQELRDPFDPASGFLPFEFQDFVPDRFRQLLG